EFNIINPNAAGIDISSVDIVVCVPQDRDDNNIRTFGAFTCDLEEIARWLVKCHIETVSMESTGIYWKQLFLVLQEHGLEVFLVNSRHVKNVTGKKTDEADAHWIMRLHTCGLLTNSFQLEEQVHTLRELLRQRKSIDKTKTIAINKMTKSLNTMNIKLNIVLSDLKSVSGQRIIAAINSGERRPKELAKLMHHKVKASPSDILKALEGNWREECLFELKQATDHYNFLQQQTLDCDKRIEEQLELLVAKKQTGDLSGLKEKATKKNSRKNEFSFSVRPYLKSIFDIDVLGIEGISDETALTLFAEAGSDLSGFKTSNRFASWIGLAPNNKVSGGKLISSHLPKKKHPIKTALIHAANSLYRSDSPLGHCYRRLKSRMGPKAAKCAMARKLAVIYYNMVTKKEEFNMELFEQHQAAFKEKRIKSLEKQLFDLKEVA
ncbi:MAG: IS110 family transposase, partial [Bacteroidales bacterium]|nr:IS110 family transposase [Bacteroidales bacterium]